nr:hypothetical protein [Microbispora cellulosiformans]
MEAAHKQPAQAQVRLSGKEWEELRETMRLLELPSTSDALREGLRLLHHEAKAEAMAQNISLFYRQRSAPPPEGDPAPTEEEFAAADAAEW